MRCAACSKALWEVRSQRAPNFHQVSLWRVLRAWLGLGFFTLAAWIDEDAVFDLVDALNAVDFKR